MEIHWEGKYVAVGLLALLLLAGLLVLGSKSGMLGKGMANLSQAGNGWVEIKPRVDSATSSVAQTETKNEIKPAKVVVEWCEVKGGKPTAEKQIIFNEIAWMGGQNSYSDEWIELKNVGGNEVDLNGWQLQNKNKKIKISFGEGEILAAGGFYLLERTDDETAPGAAADKIYKGSLGNANEALYLFDSDCVLRDAAAATSKWPAGDNAAKKTMIRLLNLNWKTSSVAGGTPGAENK